MLSCSHLDGFLTEKVARARSTLSCERIHCRELTLSSRSRYLNDTSPGRDRFSLIASYTANSRFAQ
jgi:hypothetical protein